MLYKGLASAKKRKKEKRKKRKKVLIFRNGYMYNEMLTMTKNLKFYCTSKLKYKSKDNQDTFKKSLSKFI